MTEKINGKDPEQTEQEKQPLLSQEEEKREPTGAADDPQVEEGNGGEEPAISLEQLKKEKEELYQRYLRLRADFANYRRRSSEEYQRLRRQVIEETIFKFLPVLDNLERAVASSGEEASLQTGVEMVLRQFQGILREEGVVPIKAVGEMFDPVRHEAFSREESDQPENIILEELQKGYLFGEKTLRPSLVKVSAGSGKEQEETEEKEEETTGNN